MHGVYCTGDAVRYRDDLPEPSPGPDEVVLRVVLAGICDTDIQLARGYMGYHGVLGHEFVGVDESGRRFTAEINNPCQDCDFCRRSLGNHCPNRTVLGILGHDGAMADRVAVPRANLHAIPDAIDDRRAVFIEPLAAAFRILQQLSTVRDERIAVLGDGKLGVLCAWVLRAAGARVTWIGKHPAKLQLAGQGIATLTLDNAPSLAHSFDVVVDATGSNSGLPTALSLVRPTGTVILKTTVADPAPFHLAPVVIDEVRVIGSRCGPFPEAIRALADGSIDPVPLIQREYRLCDAEDAFAAAAQPGARKILIRISG